jgi:hypothetical protein
MGHQRTTKDHGLARTTSVPWVQSFPADRLLVFSIATNKRWSNASENGFDIFVDVNNDGTPDYDVVAVDRCRDGGLGRRRTGRGRVQPQHRGRLDQLARRLADRQQHDDAAGRLQPATGANPATSLGGANQRFTYSIQSFGRTDPTTDVGDMSAKFNPFSSAVNTGMFDAVAPGGAAVETLEPERRGAGALARSAGWSSFTRTRATKRR